MESKKYLLALAIKYKGNWDDIYNAVSQREELEGSYILQVALSYEGNYITILDEEYPEHLKQCFKPPFVLFYEGNIELLKATNYKRLALNDSRHSTDSDKLVADKIMTDLPDDIAFVIGGNSELSYDIAIENEKPTIVVLAHSIDLMNKDKKDKIISQGGVIISEYANGMELSKDSIMLRYRIMATLCDKMLILSHIKKHSGTTFMVGLVVAQGKDVMVVPTSPLDTEESANNEIIAEGAIPIYNSESLCFNMN